MVYQHGTVEFRQHQGTVEHDKAENWVKLVLRMVLTARTATADRDPPRMVPRRFLGMRVSVSHHHSVEPRQVPRRQFVEHVGAFFASLGDPPEALSSEDASVDSFCVSSCLFQVERVE